MNLPDNLERLKYSLGKYTPIKNPTDHDLKGWIDTIELFPQSIDSLTRNLSPNELNYKYRPGGWNIKQVVHHCADSHMNAVIRFKLALTENTPQIRPYFEDKWAELMDAHNDQIDESVLILKGLHRKWSWLLLSLSTVQLQREYIHPEHGRKFNLAETIGNYAWHSNHHLEHIRQALHYKGEFN